MKRRSTVEKVNKILKTSDYRSIPRGTIVTTYDSSDINFLLCHKIIALAGDRYIISY